jgi:hypothetical protein
MTTMPSTAVCFSIRDGSWYFLWAAHPGHVINIARMAIPGRWRQRVWVIPASGFGCEEVTGGTGGLKTQRPAVFNILGVRYTGQARLQARDADRDEKADVMDPNSLDAVSGAGV